MRRFTNPRQRSTYEPCAAVYAAPAELIYIFTVPAALILGAVQFATPKGTLPHRAVGWLWVCLVLSAAVSSLLIQESGLHEGSLIGPFHHLFSVLTLIVLPLGVWRAHQHRIQHHRGAMVLIYSGVLVLAGLFAFRIMYVIVVLGH